jgi:catechol 2,3-dioxygenase-like lactoylglutathione lyase family enzyme
MRTLTEVACFTDDVEAMAAFYRAVLGAEPLARSVGMAIFQVGDAQLLIHRNYVPEEGQLPPESHIAFAVVDLDVVCDALQAQGLTLEVAPRRFYWGRSAYLRDPDGHLVELSEQEADA